MMMIEKLAQYGRMLRWMLELERIQDLGEMLMELEMMQLLTGMEELSPSDGMGDWPQFHPLPHGFHYILLVLFVHNYIV